MKHPLLLALLAIGLGACTAGAVGKHPVPHNACPLPGVREVRVHPALVADGWMDAILWAFDRWKEVVPGLRFTIVITDQANEDIIECVSSFIPYKFLPPEYPKPVFGDTLNGRVRIDSPNSALQQVGNRRALVLHELGHLLFGFGHTSDRTSIMFPIIQAEPVLSPKDEADARANFLLRDGADRSTFA